VSVFTIPYVSPYSRAAWVEESAVPAPAPGQRLAVALQAAAPGRPGATAIATSVTALTPGAPPVATVLAVNHNAVAVTAVHLSAVAYAADGTLLGGAAKLVPLLEPHLDTQVVLPLIVAGVPARVEVYPAFTANTCFGTER
jgi:hypothetical protein